MSASDSLPNMDDLQVMERVVQRGAYLSRLVLETLSNIGHVDARKVRQFELPRLGDQFEGISLGILRTTHDYPAHVVLRLPELPKEYFQVDGLLEPLNPTIGVKITGIQQEGDNAYQLALLYNCYVDYGIAPKSVFELQFQLNKSLFRQLLIAMDPSPDQVTIPPEPIRSHPELLRMASMDLESEIEHDPNLHVIRKIMQGIPTSA